MVRVTFLYRNSGSSRFDLDYYLNDHLSLSRQVFGEALKGIWIDRGTSGAEPGSQPPFHVIANLLFDSVDDFYAALLPRMHELIADAAKYTDAETLIQISEVLLPESVGK
ncbi:MAG: EthD family reductase [Pyrinomonadaceae bacterium]